MPDAEQDISLICLAAIKKMSDEIAVSFNSPLVVCKLPESREARKRC
jgi:hypothetical protein